MSPGNSVLCCYADLSGQMTPSAIPGGSMPSPLVEKGQLIDSIWAHLRRRKYQPKYHQLRPGEIQLQIACMFNFLINVNQFDV